MEVTLQEKETHDGDFCLWLKCEITNMPTPGTSFDTLRTIVAATAQFAFYGVIPHTQAAPFGDPLYENGVVFWEDSPECSSWPDAVGSGGGNFVRKWRNPINCTDYVDATGCGEDHTTIDGGEFLVPFEDTLTGRRYQSMPIAARWKLTLSDSCVVYGNYDFLVMLISPCGPSTQTIDEKYAWGSGGVPYYDDTGYPRPAGDPAGAPLTIGELRRELVGEMDVTVDQVVTGTGLFSSAGNRSHDVPFDVYTGTFAAQYNWADDADETDLANLPVLHETNVTGDNAFGNPANNWYASQTKYWQTLSSSAIITMGSIASDLWEYSDPTISSILTRASVGVESRSHDTGGTSCPASEPTITEDYDIDQLTSSFAAVGSDTGGAFDCDGSDSYSDSPSDVGGNVLIDAPVDHCDNTTTSTGNRLTLVSFTVTAAAP